MPRTSRRTGPRKYDPLAAYLAALPPGVGAVTLTFRAIEALIGAVLPPTAYGSSWWTNVPRMPPRPWSAAGWRVARRDVSTGRPSVTFARLPPR